MSSCPARSIYFSSTLNNQSLPSRATDHIDLLFRRDDHIQSSSSTSLRATVSFFMASQKKIYDPRQNGRPPKNQPPSFELPNQQIEVVIQLKELVNSVLPSLQNDLRHHNMGTVNPDPDKNTITVIGYPPVNGFDEITALAIVNRHDPQAELLDSKVIMITQ